MKRSAGDLDEFRARTFLRFGLGLNLIVLVCLVLAVLFRFNRDVVAGALGVPGLFSIAIRGGIALVAVPALLAKAMWGLWKRRGSKSRAGGTAPWDDRIDGPRFG